MAAKRVPLIFDTDIGDDIDDLYALYLALFHPSLELLAVTTVHGDTQTKARLVAKALRQVGRTDMPIAAGIEMSEARIKRGQRHPVPKDHATYHTYVKPSDPESGQTYPDAAEMIRNVLATSPEPVAIVGEGAMSNIAEVLRTASAAEKRNIRCIAVMAGETRKVMSEYNILCDPESADAVLNSGLPVFMGTFDVTAQLCIPMDEVEKYFAGHKNGLFRVLHDCTMLWAPRRGMKPGPVLYDLVPVFWLADPELVKTRPATVRVELEGTYTRGQTVRVGEEGPVMESVSLDAAALVKSLLRIYRAVTKSQAMAGAGSNGGHKK